LGTEFIYDDIDELQSLATGVDGLVLNAVDAGLHEENDEFPGNDLIRCELREYAENMAATKRVLVVNTLQESTDKLLLGLPVHLLVLLAREHALEDVHHDVGDSVAQVVGLVLEQRDETTQVSVEYLRNTLTQFAQELLRVLYRLRLRVHVLLVYQVDHD
jgi:hypothetical protein